MAVLDEYDVRPVDATDERVLDTAYRIVRECELADIGWSDSTRESVAALIGGPGSWSDMNRLVFAGDEPVGLLAVELDRPGREVFLDAFAVGPVARELQRALLAFGIDAARQVAVEDPDAEQLLPADPYRLSAGFWQVLAGSNTLDAGYRSVIEEAGFRPIRRFWRMLADVSEASAVPPAAPSGVTKRVAEGEDDRRTMHALYIEAFSEHFGVTHVQPFEEWLAHVEGHPGLDPSRWWIASLDDEPVGLCILDDSLLEFGEGYVGLLGVVPRGRGRGIATWLLACAAADTVARGLGRLALSVDGENTTGATALYESVGFATRQVIDVWCYPLSSAPSR